MELTKLQDNPAFTTKTLKEDAIKFSKDFMAGASAATIAKTFMAPVERVKLILQLQSAQPTLAASQRYNRMLDCFVRVPKEQGFLSFWRGNLVNILRACSQESLGFALKESMKKFSLEGIDPQVEHYRFIAGNIAAGAGAGVATFVLVYPLDFVRTRLGIDLGKAKKDREFRGMVDCFAKISRSDGISGLYKGLAPSMQYQVLYRGAYYGLFDSAQPYLAEDGKTLSFWRAFVLAQTVTFIAALSSYPLDTIRRRIMMNAGKTSVNYTGTISCAKYIYRNEGGRAFFNGALVNVVRGTGAALILALYNEMAKYM